MFAAQMLHWLESLRIKDKPYGTYLMSKSSDATIFSSCFAVFLRDLFGDLNELTDGERQAWVQLLQGCQQVETGLFIDPGFSERPLTAGHDWNYVTWQLTTFCLSALEALGAAPLYPFSFLEEWKKEGVISHWLESLNWKDPWQIGNRVMFLGIMLIADSQMNGDVNSRRTVKEFLAWHDHSQNPKTGFWGEGNASDYFEGLFGAFHQYLLYFYLDYPLQYMERIVDRTLFLQQHDGLWSPLSGGGGCEDMDAVHTLVALYKRKDYRRVDSEKALTKAYNAILLLQAKDGGFLWGIRRSFGLKDWIRQFFSIFEHGNLYYWYYSNRKAVGGQLRKRESRMPTGWVKQGIPVDEPDIYSTWVRCLTIGLICQVLPQLPHGAIQWKFLGTPGLGCYRS
jgi:hypothetical protein